MGNLYKFKTETKQAVQALGITMATFLRRVGLDCLKGVIQKSPVDTGTFRASHAIGINKLNPETVEYGVTPSNAEAIAMKQADKLKKVKEYDTVIIANSLPYAQTLEFGGYGPGQKTSGGFSKQAPKGVYRVTLEEVDGKLQRIIKEAEKK